MARVLALTQLFLVGLGGPLLHLLVKIEHKDVQPEALARLAQYLAAHMLWLFVVPILYVVIATVVRGRVNEKIIQAVGIAICVSIVAVLGTLIVLYLL
jgi:uncharacterized membrane protein YgdD (TMEM256/DUF423 family)